MQPIAIDTVVTEEFEIATEERERRYVVEITSRDKHKF